MRDLKKKSTQRFILLFAPSVLVLGAMMYNGYFFKPKNSLELYQSIAFSEDFEEMQKLMLKGYDSNIKQEDYSFMSTSMEVPSHISQITLFEYNEKTMMIITSPGTKKLKILAVEELPIEIRDYFIEIAP